MSNLNIQTDDFSGNDQIQIGDGTRLKITHIGTASISNSLSTFLLDKILVVPQITKNLLSIQKFAHDNHVYFEFHSSFFLLKVTQGTSFIMDLCQMAFTTSLHPRCLSSVFVGAWVSVGDRHRRLGHASYITVRQVLNNNKLPVGSNNRQHVVLSVRWLKAMIYLLLLQLILFQNLLN